MTRIDAHQHFWIYHSKQQTWLNNEEMKNIQRDFLPQHLEPILKHNNIDGCVSVQAASEQETFFLLFLAEKNPFIKGVVGWIDLLDNNLEERLSYFNNTPLLKSFRHIIQDEIQDDFILRSDFVKGISILEKYNYNYDILIYNKHLVYANTFVSKFPAHRFVLNHLAKPDIKNQKFEVWACQIKQLATHKNVYCKISGLVTQADFKTWKNEDFKKYIHHAIECFGTDRIMFGSDWPVCLVSATYKQVIDIIEENIHDLSDLEKEKLWGLNAIKFYNL